MTGKRVTPGVFHGQDVQAHTTDCRLAARSTTWGQGQGPTMLELEAQVIHYSSL